MTDSSPCTMSISFNTLPHLRIELYSNIPAVMSEFAANVRDADASKKRTGGTQ